MQKNIEGQLDLNIALRTDCQIINGFPCTYYVASQYRYFHEGKECQNKCCYGCSENSLCGYACNASRERNGYADRHLVYDTYECPCCGKEYELEYDEYEYCPNCGQHMEIEFDGEKGGVNE